MKNLSTISVSFLRVRSPARWLSLAFLVCSWGAVGHAAPLHYDMTPFSEVAPELQRAFEVLHEPNATDESRSPLIASLARYSAAQSEGDPHLRRAANWLRTALIAQSTPVVGAADERGAQDLDSHPVIRDSLDGATAIYRAHQAWAQGRVLEASVELLRVPPSVSGHEAAWEQGAQGLVGAGENTRALELLEGQLTLPLQKKIERRVTGRFLDLLVASGETARAIDLLEERWWSGDDSTAREAALDRLKKLGSPISSVWRFARPLLDVRGSRAGSEMKLLNKLRKRKGADRALVDWGRSLLGRLDSKSREGAVTAMANLKSKMKGDVRRPLWHLGSAMVLRRVNRDLESAMHYAALVSGWPEHPYANRARVEAAWLLSRRGLPGEAAALWAAAADSSGRGEAQRDALWWGGFAAVLRGDMDRADRDLTRLRERYGDERDGVAITWDERASYWLGRVHEGRAAVPEASREYASVASRYPMSWYGLLAEARIRALDPLFPRLYEDLSVSPEGTLRRALDPVEQLAPIASLRVVREPSLSLAVAYLRLGRTAEAIAALETLWSGDLLTGGGRVLLADLYGRSGRKQARQRVLRYGVVIAPEITPDLKEMYRHRYLLTHEEILVTECLSRGVSPSLFAGLVHVESRFKPKARSSVGAVGLAQIMPSTARLTGKALLGYKVSRSQLRRPATNLALGSALLGALMEHFRGHAPVALASYNAGRGAARGWLRDRGHLATDAFVESIPYAQTRRYAMRVVSMAHVYKRLYGFEGDIPEVPTRLPLALESFDADNPKP